MLLVYFVMFGLCCKCCFYLLSVTIVVFVVSSIFVTIVKDPSTNKFMKVINYFSCLHNAKIKSSCLCEELFDYPKIRPLTYFIL